MDFAGALARHKATHGECHAAVWMKNRLSGEWYEWDTCTLDPGHDGLHEIEDSSWRPWSDGNSGRERFVDADLYPDQQPFTEWRTEPSPWTVAEIDAWRSV